MTSVVMVRCVMSRCTKKNCPMQYGTVSIDCDIKDCSWRTEDAVWVKVVRCKECVHNGEFTDCPLNGYAKTDDSFCSYGEREGE